MLLASVSHPLPTPFDDEAARPFWEVGRSTSQAQNIVTQLPSVTVPRSVVHIWAKTGCNQWLVAAAGAASGGIEPQILTS